MRTFIKVNMASIIASASDFIFTFIMVEFFKSDKVLAGIGGTVTGGIINFIICRYWAFKAIEGEIIHQGKKYFITWAGNLLLNATGLYLLIHFAGTGYMLAKLITSLTVAFTYNYPLQKKYVFKKI